jgi:hypothetical protein
MIHTGQLEDWLVIRKFGRLTDAPESLKTVLVGDPDSRWKTGW